MAQAAAQTTSAQEHAPAGEHERFPPFDSTSFASQIFWLALTFVILYAVMSRVALPRIGSILEDRRRRIDGDLQEAQRLKGDADATLAAHEKTLGDARARAQTLASETRTKASAAVEAKRKEVDAKLAMRIAEAEKGIAATRAVAMGHVHGIATDAAAAIMERLTGKQTAGPEIAAAVDRVLKR
ncbi:MAG TPA: F0F1 ATP synthase subunit B' [Xanthobacteraceae bacterium]|jgi:F-type H+-transporting ATPase subunit b